MRVKSSVMVALLAAAALFFQTPTLAKETEKKPSKGAPIPDAGPWIDVLTFNIWNIIGAQDAKVRAVAIGRKIAELDPDLVAFEEAFDQSKRQLLIDNLKKAVELNPENCETYYSIAEIYKYMGKEAEAREWEKKGLVLEEKEEKE